MVATPGARPDPNVGPHAALPPASHLASLSPPLTSRRQRIFACGVGLLGWLALVLQFYATLSARIELGASVAGGVVHLLSYFTILTNLLVAVTATLQGAAPATRTARWLGQPALFTGTTTSIVFVGIAYSVLLRHLSHAQGLELLANHLLHDLIPPLFLVYWWCFVGRATVGLAHLLRWSLYPIAYFCYVLVRGALFGLYPYPFVNVDHLGYARVILNALAILVGFWTIGALLIGAYRCRGRARRA